MHGLLLRLGLRFEDAEEERRFVDRFIRGNIGWTQVAMLLGAATYAGYTLWDWILYPQIVPTTILIRGGVALLVLLPLTALLSKSWKRHAEAIYLVYCVIPGIVLPSVYLVLPSGFTHAAAGLIIVILFVSTLLPLRVGALAIFCVLTWLSLTIFEAIGGAQPEGLSFITHSLIGNAYALALFAVGAREYQARKRFRTTEALRREKERSETSLAALRTTQAHLVQAEKLAALGKLVAGVAHEVSTPIGLALTASTTLESEVRALARTIASGQVRRSDLTRGIERFENGLSLTSTNLYRAAELLDSFKQLANDHSDEARQTFDLLAWLTALASRLAPLLKRNGLTIAVACPSGIAMETYPGALAQVIHALAVNAAVHGYPDDQPGLFEITATAQGGEVTIVCADRGIGIAAVDRDRVFEPFFTTKRDQGHVGLGLHIVFNLVVSTLGGRLTLASEDGVGTRVTMTLPRHAG
jgi:signal transduction histidine kinase